MQISLRSECFKSSLHIPYSKARFLTKADGSCVLQLFKDSWPMQQIPSDLHGHNGKTGSTLATLLIAYWSSKALYSKDKILAGRLSVVLAVALLCQVPTFTSLSVVVICIYNITIQIFTMPKSASASWCESYAYLSEVACHHFRSLLRLCHII